MNKPRTNAALLRECSDLRIQLARSKAGIKKLADIVLRKYPLDDPRTLITLTICLAAGIQPKKLL